MPFNPIITTEAAFYFALTVLFLYALVLIENTYFYFIPYKGKSRFYNRSKPKQLKNIKQNLAFFIFIALFAMVMYLVADNYFDFYGLSFPLVEDVFTL